MTAQNNVQKLQPVRLSIFKNGTYFVKKEAQVKIENNAFSIPAPTNVLMGSYWLAAGKESIIKSIVLSQDSFRVETKATGIADYLKANLNKKIKLQEYSYFSDSLSLTGILLDYDEQSRIAKIKIGDGEIVVLNVSEYKKLTVNADNTLKAWTDSFAVVAKINVKPGISSTMASSFALEKGIQWYPSYLLKIVNDKEAKLEMKATIINGSDEFKNADIDLVIGTPEMFYGQQLDPVCLGYLHGQIFEPTTYDNNTFQLNTSAISNQSYYTVNSPAPAANSSTDGGNDGEKLEDLYFFKMGKMDLLKNAHVIIPVAANTVQYQDIYTAEVPTQIADAEAEAGIPVLHNFRITNSSDAPLTTGSVLVMNQNELPMAQSQLKYTSVKGITDILLAKAIDVKVKNEEVENKREASTKKNSDNEFYDKVLYKGTVSIVNYQAKKIVIKVKKYLQGQPGDANLNGKIKKTITDDNDSVNASAVIEWEVELLPGQKKELTYTYTSYKK